MRQPFLFEIRGFFGNYPLVVSGSADFDVDNRYRTIGKNFRISDVRSGYVTNNRAEYVEWEGEQPVENLKKIAKNLLTFVQVWDGDETVFVGKIDLPLY